MEFTLANLDYLCNLKTYDSLQLLMKVRHDVVVSFLLQQGYNLPDHSLRPQPDLEKNGVFFDVTFSMDPSIIAEKESKNFQVIYAKSLDLPDTIIDIIEKIEKSLSPYSMLNYSGGSFLLPEDNSSFDLNYENKPINFQKMMEKKTDIPYKSVIKDLNTDRSKIVIGDCKDHNVVIFGSPQVKCYDDDHIQALFVAKKNYHVLSSQISLPFIRDMPKRNPETLIRKQVSCPIKPYQSITELINYLSCDSSTKFDNFSTSFKDYESFYLTNIMNSIAIFSSICEDLLFMSIQKLRANQFKIVRNKKYGNLIIMASGPPLSKKGATRFYRFTYVDRYNHMGLSGWRSIKSVNLNYYLGLYRSLMSFNLISKEREPSLSRQYLTWHNFIAYTKNSSFNDSLLIMRYLHMNCMSLDNKSSILIKEKLDKPWRYNYIGHFLAMMIKNTALYKYNIEDRSIMEDYDSVGIDADKPLIFSVTSLITGEILRNPQTLINEMYLGYYTEINPENKLSMQTKVINKVSKMMVKELDAVFDTDLTHDVSSFDWYKYDSSNICTETDKYVKKLQIDKTAFAQRLSKTRFNQNIIQLANLNGSCEFNDPSSGRSVTSYESMIQLIQHYKSTDSFKVAEQIVNSDYEYNMRIAPKVQHGGERDLMVQDPRTKLCNAVADSIFEALCSFDSQEMLTKQDRKVFTQMQMTIPEKNTYLLFDVGDNTSWGPNMVPKQFIAMLPCLKDIIGTRLCNFLYKHFNKMSSKFILKPVGYDDSRYIKELLPNDYLKTMYGKQKVKQIGNMGQGILHYTSSFMHGACINSIDDQISKLHGVRRIQTIFSSDDYFRSICLDNDVDVTQIFKEIENITLCGNRSFNIIKNVYKSVYTTKINEFNSQFAIGQSFLTPDVVFMIPVFMFDPVENKKNLIMSLFQKLRTYGNKTVTLNELDIVTSFALMHYSIFDLKLSREPRSAMIKFLGMDEIEFDDVALLKPLRNIDVITKNNFKINKDIVLPNSDYLSSVDYGVKSIFNSKKGYELIDRSFSIMKMIINSRKPKIETIRSKIEHPNQKLYLYVDNFLKSIRILRHNKSPIKNYFVVKALGPVYRFKNSPEVIYLTKNKKQFDERFIKNHFSLKSECFLFESYNDLNKLRDDYDIMSFSLPNTYLRSKRNGTFLDILRQNFSNNLICGVKTKFESVDNEFIDSSLLNLNRLCHKTLGECTFLTLVEQSMEKSLRHLHDKFLEYNLEKTCLNDLTGYRHIKKFWDIITVTHPDLRSVYRLNPNQFKFKNEQKFDSLTRSYDRMSDCTIIGQSSMSQVQITLKNRKLKLIYYGVNNVDALSLAKSIISKTLLKNGEFKFDYDLVESDTSMNMYPDIEKGNQIECERSMDRLFFDSILSKIDSVDYTIDDSDLSLHSVEYGSVRFPNHIECPIGYKHPLNVTEIDPDILREVLDYYGSQSTYSFKKRYDNEVNERIEDDWGFDQIDFSADLDIKQSDFDPTKFDEMEVDTSRRVKRLTQKLNDKIFKHYMDLCLGLTGDLVCRKLGKGDYLKSDLSLREKTCIVLSLLNKEIYDECEEDHAEFEDIFDSYKVSFYKKQEIEIKTEKDEWDDMFDAY
jgi:hypothetical protein